MKIKRILVSLGLGCVAIVLQTGCATSKLPTLDTWCNPQFSPTPKDSIALTDQPAATSQEEALGKLLVDELNRENFSVVPANQADYLLAYVMDEEVQKQQVVHASPYYYDPMMQPGPLTPQTDAQMFREPVTKPLPDRVVTYRFTDYCIRLMLYTNPKTHHGDFQLVWQGNVDAPHSASSEQEQLLIRALLSHFGEHYDGRIHLSPHG